MRRQPVVKEQLRVAFWTLGCRLNQYETESLKVALAAAEPVHIVPWHEAADVYILNSCTVTGKADQECRRLARQAKRRSPLSKVVVAGCYAQTQPSVLQAIPEIDGVIGNTDKHDIQSWLADLLRLAGPLVRVQDFRADEPFMSGRISNFAGRSRAYVKIQDGCDLRCAYCLIWRARGPGRSRPVADVLHQLAALIHSGYREVVLAGVHLGAYGRDLGQPDGLVNLLRKILCTFPELRVRLSSMHPNEIGPSLRQLFAAYPNLRPHLHISLQSGCDAVLRRMRRPYRSVQAWRAIDDLAATRLHFGLGADLIVGFPQETDSEFAATCQFVESLPFSYLHVFRFSPRPGTPAASFPGPVHPDTIRERALRLRRLARRQHSVFLRSLLGHWQEAVVESPAAEKGWAQATTENYATVLMQPGLPAGSLVRLRAGQLRAGRLYVDAMQQILPGGATTAEVW
jgi:threonylcarbamoyladenosine tRNA methylthiotransferase MtaB